MKDETSKNKKSKSNDMKQTLDYIFNIDQREVFENELNCLKEEIENNNLDLVKIPAIMNFVIYKANELNFHSKLSESLITSSKNSVIEDYLIKENFSATNKHISNFVKNHNLISFSKYNTTVDNKLDTKIQKENNPNKCENEVDSFLKFDSNNLKEDKGNFFSKIENEGIHFFVKTSDANFSIIKNETKSESLHNSEKKENSLGNNLNSNSHKGLINKDANFESLIRINNKEDKTKSTTINIPYKKKIVYQLKIFYLDGSENSAQFCNIEIEENCELNSFILQLKKQLGIYEYAKFKIVLMNELSNHRIYLKDLSQLKTNQVNEIKIIPI